MAVDPDSTVDISRAYRFAQLPNLAYFVSSGFPFTRMADLSDTAVVLPANPNAGEISGYLNLMGRIGSLTGYPVLRLAVVHPDELQSVKDRNILLIGTIDRLGAAADLLKNTAYQVNGNKLDIKLTGSLDSIRRLFGDPQRTDRDAAATALTASASEGGAVLVGGESPLRSGRSVVALLGGTGADVIPNLVTALRDPDQVPLVRGDLALLTGGRFTSYRVGPEYTSGSLPIWIYPSWLLRDSPLSIVVVMVVGSALLGLFYYFGLRRRAAMRARQTPTTRQTSLRND